MHTETVPGPLAGERVDRVVAFIADCSRSEAAALIDQGKVTHNARKVRKASVRVVEGDVIQIDASTLQSEVRPAPEPSIEIPVVHVDDHVIVVNKPAGLVVHPGAGTPAGTMVNGLLARFPELADVGDAARPGIVHRLDKGTSGLLMVARTESDRTALAAQLADRSVERCYLTVVWGHLSAAEGIVDAPLGRDPRHPTRRAVVAGGRDARTRYTVLRSVEDPTDVSVLECRLETGRTHQIRAHLAAIDHPVVGDDLYGGARPALEFPRPALHAAVLGFTHPETGERLRFEVAPPDDLQRLLDTLG